jgi:hypothetical protein
MICAPCGDAIARHFANAASRESRDAISQNPAGRRKNATCRHRQFKKPSLFKARNGRLRGVLRFTER